MLYSAIQTAALKRTLAVFTLLAMVFGPVTSAFAVEVVDESADLCTNLPDIQITVPGGYTADGTICTEIPADPEDLCPNIQGTQATLSEDMTVVDGICVMVFVPDVDVCDNIDGNQDSVPKGYEADGSACYKVTTEDPIQECITGNLLTNGSFEDPAVVAHDGQWEIFPSVAGWTSSSEDGIELWNNFLGAASNGAQNVELDGNAPTAISQSVTTVPGNKYQITFDFAPRPHTPSTDNDVEVSFSGDVLGSVTGDGSADETKVWTTHNFAYTAWDTNSELSLKDLGDANGTGSLIDNVSVCLVKDNSELPTHRISGYKFNDANANGSWDETEVGIPGWTITVENSEVYDSTLSTTTDADGYYYFDVPEGSYTVSEVGQAGWEHTATLGDGADGDMCYYTVGDDVEMVSKLISKNTYNCNFGNHEVEVQHCELTANLLANGSFETPVIDSEGSGWGVFDSVINGLQWAVTWINPSEDAPEVAKLELQNGRPASEGNQFAELDSNYTNPDEPVILGDARVKIAQTIATIPGNKYTLTYDFSAVPGHGKAINNKVEVVINGSVVDTQTASLPHGATTTNWTHQSFTFTATGTQTEVALADAGKANTFGTLIDNVSLVTCASEEPAKVCSVNVVSDTTNTVTEKAGANAVLTWVHPAWMTAIVDSSAQWIWGTATVEHPDQEEVETFVKKFNWNGPATAALLKVAADNNYSVKLNGNTVGSDMTGGNFAATDDINVQSGIVTGENTLEFTVTNLTGGEGANSEGNPAGLLYDLTVTGNDTVDCTDVDGGGDNGDTYKIFGYVWNDTDKDDSKDLSEDNLSGWIVKATNTETSQVVTDETDADGKYELNVEAGTWIIAQETEDGWHQLSEADGSGTYTVTVPEAVMTMAFPLNLLFSVAEAATLGTVGPKNFGNEYVGSRGGSSSSRSRKSSVTPNGAVLGAATSTLPAGQVLGAATSTMPTGAPNTGAGGSSSIVITLPILSAILTTEVTRRKSK